MQKLFLPLRLNLESNFEDFGNSILDAFKKELSKTQTNYADVPESEKTLYEELFLSQYAIDYIDTTNIHDHDRWISMPKFDPDFNRISGFQIGLKKELIYPSPFGYHSKMGFLYSHAREDIDYSILFTIPSRTRTSAHT